MKEAKIHFSRAEAELMGNTEIILTKNSVLQKVKSLLEILQMQLVEMVQYKGWQQHALFEMPPKISKGENYMGLPYLVLDYPRQFDSVHIFAIRTMFWWGHFFSITLQLSGQYKDEFLQKIEAARPQLARHQYFIGINEDPWVHHFDEDNYTKIKELDEEAFTTLCRQFDHLKIAARWSLQDVHFVDEELTESWLFLVKLCLD